MLGSRFTFEVIRNKQILEDDDLVLNFVQHVAIRLRYKFPRNKIIIDDVQIEQDEYYSWNVRIRITITVFHIYLDSFTKGLDEVNE